MLLVLLCTQLTYYVAYDVDYVQAFILGTALAWVFQHQRESALSSRPADATDPSPAQAAYGARAGA
jgi:hypothetical protein